MMKKEIGIILGCIGVSSCQFFTEKPGTDYVSVIVDKTDSMTVVYELTPGHIDKMLRITDIPNAGADVRIGTITHSRYTSSWHVAIPDNVPLLGNEYSRLDSVRTFLDNLHRCIDEVRRNYSEQDESHVFHAVFDALNDLAEVPHAHSKTLLVMSDLCENTSRFSVYRATDLKLVQEQPEQIRSMWEHDFPIQQSLKGITVYFVHRSIGNSASDDLFHLVASLLAEHLESHGARVEITGSLNDIHQTTCSPVPARGGCQLFPLTTDIFS